MSARGVLLMHLPSRAKLLRVRGGVVHCSFVRGTRGCAAFAQCLYWFIHPLKQLNGRELKSRVKLLRKGFDESLMNGGGF